MRKKRLKILVMFFATFSTCSSFAEWGRWKTIGDGSVAVRFSQIKSNTCTWQIKNTGPDTLNKFDFTYTYAPADSLSPQKTDKDTLPYPLKAGGVAGGWTVYSANTRRCPATLVTLQLERIRR